MATAAEQKEAEAEVAGTVGVTAEDPNSGDPSEIELPAGELPDQIATEEHLEALVDALAVGVPAAFPENDNYPEADQPEAIAEVLIPRLHPDLQAAKIAYFYRQTLRSGGTPVRYKMLQPSGRFTKVSGYVFCLDFNYELWTGAGSVERIRTVDECLRYCGREEDGSWTKDEPDVVAHVGSVKLWGPREGGERELAEAVDQMQLALGQGD